MRTLIALPIMSMLACGAPMPGDQGAIGKPGGAGAMGAPGAMGLPGKDASVAGSRLRPAVYVGSDEHCQIQPMGTILLCAPAEMFGKLTEQNSTQYVRFQLE